MTGEPQPDRRRAVIGGLALLMLCALGAVAAMVGLAEGFDAESIAGHADALGVWGPVAVVGLMIVHCFVPFPAELVALGAGAAFGAWAGGLWVWIGAMIGAALSFALARRLGRPFVEAMLPADKVGRLDAWSARLGASTLLAARLAPVIAFNLVNYAAGLTHIGWWTFLWTTAVGILPITLICTLFGAAMRELDWKITVALLAAAALTLLAGRALARRRD